MRMWQRILAWRTCTLKPRKSWLHPYVGMACLTCGFSVVTLEFAWVRVLPPLFRSILLNNAWVILCLLIGVIAGGLHFGRKADRVIPSLRVLAAIQLGIGISSILVLPLFLSLESLPRILRGDAVDSYLPVEVVGGVFSMAILFVPGFLFGGIVPLGVRLLSDKNDEAALAGRLYSLTFLGCFAGALVSRFALMPSVGSTGTLMVGAAAIAGLGLPALFVREKPAARAERWPGLLTSARPNKITLLLLMACLVYLVSVFTYVIVWTRVLRQMMGNTVYVSGMAVGVCLGGVSAGSAISASLVRRSDDRPLWYGIVSGLMGVFGLCTLLIVNDIPFTFLKFFGAMDPGWRSLVVAYGLVSLLVLFPAGVLLGAALPLTRQPFSGLKVTGGTASGITQASAALGLLIALLLTRILPSQSITMRAMLGAVSWACFACALVFLLQSGGSLARRLVSPLGLMIAATWLSISSPAWNEGVITAGLYMHPESFSGMADLSKSLSDTEVVFYEEDRDAVVAAVRAQDALVLRTNGTPVASTVGDMTSQILAGHIAMLVHREPKRALFIGLGSGIAVGSAATYPLEEIDCLEPIASMSGGAQVFSPYNRNILKDERLSLIPSDPSNHLLLEHRAYDVIVHQPHTVCPSHIEGLLTTEFIVLARSRLAADGIVCVHLRADRISLQTLKSLVRGFAYQFPHASLWWTGYTEVLLIGSMEPLKISITDMKEKMGLPGVRDDLDRIRMTDYIGILSCYTMDRESMLRFAGDVPFNTRVKPLLTYQEPKRLGRGSLAGTMAAIDSLKTNPVSVIEDLENRPVEYAIAQDEFTRCMTSRTSYVQFLISAQAGRRREAASLLEEAIGACPENGALRLRLSDFYILVSRDLAGAGRFGDAINVGRRSIEAHPENHRAFYNLAALELSRDIEAGIGLLRRAIELNPHYVPAYLLKAEAELSSEKIEEATATLSEVLGFEPLNLRAHYLRALSLIERDFLEDARTELAYVLEASPENVEVLSALAYSWLLEDDPGKAQDYYEKILRIDPDDPAALNNLAALMAERGDYEEAIRLWRRALSLDPSNQSIGQSIKEARQMMRRE
jgi:spermidine synthase